MVTMVFTLCVCVRSILQYSRTNLAWFARQHFATMHDCDAISSIRKSLEKIHDQIFQAVRNRPDGQVAFSTDFRRGRLLPFDSDDISSVSAVKRLRTDGERDVAQAAGTTFFEKTFHDTLCLEFGFHPLEILHSDILLVLWHGVPPRRYHYLKCCHFIWFTWFE